MALRGGQKFTSSRMAEFGRYGGRGFITNPLSMTEWNLIMFSIIFCTVSMLENVKQRQRQPKKRFSLLTVEGFLTIAMKQLVRLVNTKVLYVR